MAYYAALVSTIQLLKEMSLPEHQYPKSLFEKQQITSLHETLSHLLELLEDYSPNDKDVAGFLDRISDAACLAQDLIECQVPDAAMGSHVPSAAGREKLRTPWRYIPSAIQKVKSIVELQIDEKIHRPNCLEEIIHVAFLYFVSACHNAEYANKEAVYTLRGGYEDLRRLSFQIEYVIDYEYRTLVLLIEAVRYITMENECLDALKLKEEVDPIVINQYHYLTKLKEELESIIINQYHDLMKLKEELDAIAEKEYHNSNGAKKAVDSILDRGSQNLQRVKEAIDSIVGKGYNYFQEKVKEAVDSIVGRGYQDLERVKEEVDSIVGRGYQESMKEEVDSIVIKGYQDLVKLKEEINSIVEMGSVYLFWNLKTEFDSIGRRGHQDLERMKEEVNSIAEKGYKVLFEKVKEGVDSIVKDLKRIKEKIHTTHQNDFQVGAGRISTQGASDGTTMVGFQQHQTTLKDQLFGDSSRLELISIVGMGGIGKTTLARSIFDDKAIENHFDFRVWVTVSQSYDLRDILLAIVDSLDKSKEDLSRVEEGLLKQRIYKRLFGKRYLIIMDDVWDTKIWGDMQWIFPNDNKSRSRIMITTRHFDVASLASESDFINQISTLPHHQGWNLFSEKVHCPPELEDIGRSIVRNCGGLPLAIVVVAGLLSKVNTTRSDWEEVASDLSSIASANDEHFSKILSLSYNYLPHHLKPCFLYLGGFPEDYKISIARLIKLWVAEGFLKPVVSKCLEEAAEDCLEEAAEDCLEELVKRNLVLITEVRSNGKFKSCTVHDLLRDLCLERARHEHFLLLQHKHIATYHIQRLFIHPNSSYTIDVQKNNIRHVRSIVSVGDGYHDFVSPPSIFKPLRVLDAFAYFRFPQPNGGIFELINLRFVRLYVYGKTIPSSISQTLIACSSRSYEISLPAEIWKMPQLRHVLIEKLKLPSSSDVSDRPSSLQTLSTPYNCRFTSGIVKMIPNIKKLKLKYKRSENAWTGFGLRNLVHLHQLETLVIDIFIARFVEVPFPESFAFPSNLRKLTLDGCQLPWRNMSTVGTLPHLQVLQLRRHAFVGEKWETEEGEFSKLKFLQMELLSDLKYWRTESSHFPCLEHLVIASCTRLNGIPSEAGEFPNLELIEVWKNNFQVTASAREIQKEQSNVGNETLQVRVY